MCFGYLSDIIEIYWPRLGCLDSWGYLVDICWMIVGYMWDFWGIFREDVKYHFADFVRKGGSTPQIRNPLFAENFVR